MRGDKKIGSVSKKTHLWILVGSTKTKSPIYGRKSQNKWSYQTRSSIISVGGGKNSPVASSGPGSSRGGFKQSEVQTGEKLNCEEGLKKKNNKPLVNNQGRWKKHKSLSGEVVPRRREGRG